MKKNMTLHTPFPFFLLFLFLLFFCTSCSKPEPIKIGFVGGLTGRVASLGIAGRDGAALAIEEANSINGINGKTIELIVKDDKQDQNVASEVDKELITEGVSAIIGHMTSSMSIAGAPIANQAKTLMLSPTTSTIELANSDDSFFRVYATSSDVAKQLATHAYQTRGYKKISVIYDIRNRAHTEGWYINFKKKFEDQGGTIVDAITYFSEPKINFFELAQKLTTNDTDCIFILANAIDTAMLCQQLVKLNKKTPVITSEWSVTGDIIKHGGKSVEGIEFFNTFDHNNTSTAFLDFKSKFKQRFSYEPGFASVYAYDAAQILIQALQENSAPGQLKETVLKIKKFQGLQSTITFNEYGDVKRPYFLMTIKDGVIMAAHN